MDTSVNNFDLKSYFNNSPSTLTFYQDTSNIHNIPAWVKDHFLSPCYYECTFEGFKNVVDEFTNYKQFFYDTLTETNCISNSRYFLNIDYKHLLFHFTVGLKSCGHKGFAHGGFTATLVDSTMGSISSAYVKSQVVTKNLNIEYKRPIECGETLISSSLIKDIVSDKYIHVICDIYDEKNERRIHAEATFVKLAKKWAPYNSDQSEIFN